MIVDSAVYRAGTRLDVGCEHADYERLREVARAEDGFVWVGLLEPSAEELGTVADAFALHPLAVDDALSAHQRPKVETYDTGLFLVLKTLWYLDETDAVETGEIHLFVGEDFIVSVRHGQGSELASARRALESQRSVLTHGPSAVVYGVCDRVVDAYERVLEELQTDVDQVEESVFSTSRTDDAVRIYTLKREVAEVRRAVLPLREAIRRLAVGDVPGIDGAAAPFLRDVLDHLQRAAEAVDALDSLLSTAFDAHLARISIQQNDDMRKISAGVALVAVPTLIAGIYGMNFAHMPELSWTYGYPFSLLLMGSISLGLWVVFKRSGWL